ncbi:MAG: TrmH family RNA methyltransferase [Thermoleophilia bacterium]
MKLKSITSSANIIIKEAARLKRKKNRQSRRLFLAEGEDLLEAAVTNGVTPRQVFVLDGAEEAVLELLEEAPHKDDAAVYSVSTQVMDKLSSMGGNCRVVASFDFRDTGLSWTRDEAPGNNYVFLAGLSDPGNVGAIIRSAAALGAAGVIVSPETADPYGPRAVQASMGAVFTIPLLQGYESVPSLFYWASEQGLATVAADHRDGEVAWECDLAAGFMLVMGAERTGLPEDILQRADLTVRIPQRAGTDSLNVAMAATAILYESARQRAHSSGA